MPVGVVRYVEAFGERKSIRDWAADPRCVVQFKTLKFRVDAGMDPESALAEPLRDYGAPSARCLAIYRWIYGSTKANGYQPGIRDVGQHFGIGSPNGVICFFDALARCGYIRRSEGDSRALRFLKTPDGRPFRGFADKQGEGD